ncbi:MAG: zinc ribbon domain-containing protein [Firmicutes bacterium]|nr:zinc ribbon domain-containing protein [Bacillota bacterium]
MRCFGCGEENSSENVFCQNCGRRLKPSEAPVNDAAVEPASETPISDAPNDAPEAPVSDAADEPASETPVSDAADETASETPVSGAPDETAPDGESRDCTPNVETLEDGGYRIVYEKNKICPICGESLPADVNFCTNCSHKFTDAPKPKRKGIKAAIICAIAAAAIAFIGIVIAAVCIIYPKIYNIEGMWVSQQENISFFGITSESYMLIGDDSLEYYYSAFLTEEYDYSYNAFTKTLTLYSNGRKTETLHLQWIGTDTFIILENGNTFSRVNGEYDSGGEKQYSI